jgi:predicted regulator of Ras-like GTPase activity (Roadblock/LC7/MglB family)
MEHGEMETVLRDINAVVGVTGSFVCDEEGHVIARLLPNVFDTNMLSPVGRTVAQTIAGLKIVSRRRVDDLDLVYDDGRLIVKNVGDGCLCVLCVKRVNVPLLNLTVNVAVKKLQEKLKEAPPPPPIEQTKTEAETESKPVKKMTLAELMASNIRY